MTARYTRTAQALHWTLALLLVGMVSLGLYMHELELSPLKLQLYSYHKWAGVSVFLLVLARLAWRATHRPPPLPAGTAPLVRVASSTAHALLYALMIAIPLSGWLMSSAKGFQTVWFGVLPIPDLLGKDVELGERLAEVHEALNFTLIGLVTVHAAAALKHHFIDKDGLLHRMWPGRSRRPTEKGNKESAT